MELTKLCRPNALEWHGFVCVCVYVWACVCVCMCVCVCVCGGVTVLAWQLIQLGVCLAHDCPNERLTDFSACRLQANTRLFFFLSRRRSDSSLTQSRHLSRVRSSSFGYTGVHCHYLLFSIRLVSVCRCKDVNAQRATRLFWFCQQQSVFIHLIGGDDTWKIPFKTGAFYKLSCCVASHIRQHVSLIRNPFYLCVY